MRAFFEAMQLWTSMDIQVTRIQQSRDVVTDLCEGVAVVDTRNHFIGSFGVDCIRGRTLKQIVDSFPLSIRSFLQMCDTAANLQVCCGDFVRLGDLISLLAVKKAHRYCLTQRYLALCCIIVPSTIRGLCDVIGCWPLLRVWIVDSHARLKGLVTLTDVLKAIITVRSEQPLRVTSHW